MKTNTNQSTKLKDSIEQGRDVRKSKSNNRRNFGSKNKNKSRTRDNGRNDRGLPSTYMDKSNPIEWYNKYPNLLESAGRVAFPYRPGMSLELAQGFTTQIPGVMVLEYAPTVGYSNNVNSPISQVAKEFYGRVRASFSSELAVDPPDFVMYLMALDSIFSNIAFLKRVYRIVNTYSPDNYVLPDLLLRSMGFTVSQIQDLRNNWTAGWGYINSLVNMTRKFRCPAVMDVFNRHYWLNDNVYTDAPTINSQFYMFKPSGYYVFDETTDPNGTSLKYTEMSSLIGTWVSMYATVEAQIGALASSSDAYTISGYLQRAFEGVNNFYVEELPQLEKLSPVYDALVLMQIENSKSMPVTHATLDITQDVDSNSVISKPCIMAPTGIPQTLIHMHQLLNIRSDQPTVAEVTEATRLMATCSNPITIGSVEGARTIDCGTEIVEKYTLWAINASNAPFSQEITTYGDAVSSTSTTILNNRLIRCSLLSKFDWHPVYIVYVAQGTEGLVAVQDFYNISNIDDSTLINLHRVCLYSEFNAFSII